MATTGNRSESPLVVIVGPTASGKTALALDLARRFNGEIICADSRTIYKGMDIGTAKPDEQQRALVPHWGLDLVEPGVRFTAADFQVYAKEKIADIRSRGKVPFLVGGTGLYINAVLYEYEFGKISNDNYRQKLESMSTEELQKYCQSYNIVLPENDKNKRYIIRAIEQNGINNTRKVVPINNSIIVGITTDKDILRTRIIHRNEQLFADGVVEEAKVLGKKYGWNNEAMTGNIYKLLYEYFQGAITLDAVKELSSIRDRQLAKRQLTWFRRDKHIRWFDRDGANSFLSRQLEN